MGRGAGGARMLDTRLRVWKGQMWVAVFEGEDGDDELEANRVERRLIWRSAIGGNLGGLGRNEGRLRRTEEPTPER